MQFSGKDVFALDALDIYRGFKEIERNGYEVYHQAEPLRRKVSLVAWVCGLRRVSADYLLQWLGKDQ